MAKDGNVAASAGLARLGLTRTGEILSNLPVAELYERALTGGEGMLASNGALVCSTGSHTGRSPGDKYTVEEPTTREAIWWGPNRALSEASFDRLHRRIVDHYASRRVYVRDLYAGADPRHRLNVRVVTETAWHGLFANQLFIRPERAELEGFDPDFTVLNAPTCLADPQTDGTRSPTFVVIHFARRLILIGGTAYAGEIKKSIFTVMNYLLPVKGVLSMHCSANVGAAGDTALFFGLSGTGKTTLSADPQRRLIGDDEHGWSDDGVFNIEGGCYAKCIRLSREHEPQIYAAIRYGAVLENVVLDPRTRDPDYDSQERTENTRAAYPLTYIDNAVIPSVGPHPKHVVFLTCDAFGVLPPIARLTPAQTMYHFISGYTAKVAGTERGVTEPQATFSTCFGAPFLPLPPMRYATMLSERVRRHGARCWLVNTGWNGGPHGVGKRMSLRHTRAMIRAALSGELERVAFEADPVFGIEVPTSCPHVPPEVLRPRRTWSDPAAYDAQAAHLARLFVDNIRKFEGISAEVRSAGPRNE
ncbi:MAG: Phosphoenolpyruvate carboxykinase (ATP) [Phycisphaerae bacterium]|nr:Phosphoenolpyruvate carboxykinase (ATP) [Phycisphaerae bacterium]